MARGLKIAIPLAILSLIFVAVFYAAYRASGSSGPASISGRVVDAVTGKPVEEFEVAVKEGTVVGGTLWTTQYTPMKAYAERLDKLVGRRWRGQFETLLGMPVSGYSNHVLRDPPRFARTTDPNGAWRSVMDGTSATVFVRANGYALSRTPTFFDRGAKVQGFVVSLTRESPIKFRVLNTANEPISDAMVFAGLPTASAEIPATETEQQLSEQPIAVSSANGEFEIKDLPSDFDDLFIMHRKFAPTWCQLDRMDQNLQADIILTNPASIGGTIMVGGTIRADRIKGDCSAMEIVYVRGDGTPWYRVIAFVDSEGKYQADNLPSGVAKCRWMPNYYLGAGARTESITLAPSDKITKDVLF